MTFGIADPATCRRNPFLMVLAYRKPLWRTTVSEVRQRYAGSAIGIFWVGLAPGLLLALYAFVFIYIYKTVPEGMGRSTYLVQLFAGLLPFLAFSDGLLSGAGAVSTNRAVLLNTVYPAELVPLRAVLSGHAVAGLGLFLVAGLALATGHPLQGLALLPVVFALQIMFVCGLAWPLSLANLVLRDIQQILTFLCTALMIVSPIAYAPSAAPGPLKLLVYLNPLSYFVLATQSLVVTGSLPPIGVVLVMTALSFAAFLIGFRLFQRGKLAFWDYV